MSARLNTINDTSVLCQRLLLEFALLAVCALPLGCRAPEKSHLETAPSPATIEAKQKQLATMSPPDLEHAREAVKRIFKDNAVVEVSRQPYFVAGDFNGDLSQDLAVIVKPVPAKLSEMNEEFPAWILRDPFQPTVPLSRALRVEDTDLLLAIIHGFGPDGWQDSQATQTYLLKNAVGSSLRVQAARDLIAASRGKSLPRLQGDVISETIRDSSGYLYYDGPTYSWYDPKTFKPEVRTQFVHGQKPVMTR